MNILFMTLGRINSIEDHSLYADLLRCFRDHGHEIYIISPVKAHSRKKNELLHERGSHILKIGTANLTKTQNLFRKGLAQLSLGLIYMLAVKRYFSKISFDLILYSTPPITLVSAIEYVKKRDGARTYLMLKDIFPQNVVDIGMMSKYGVKGLLYRYFRRKEKRFYQISDRIGCMSQANVDYVLRHNPEVDPAIVEICPNSIEVIDKSIDSETRRAIREKYGIPQNKKVFVYGGNLGRPQSIPFIIECLKQCRDLEHAFFLIVGDGTEYGKLEAYSNSTGQPNLKLMRRLPKEDYDTLVAACDVGLIFLDHRFTIPNFPSRLLGYMQAKLPVLACTDPNTDVGKVIAEGGFGWWCESSSPETFKETIGAIMRADIKEAGEKGFNWLDKYWNVKKQYRDIAEAIGINSEHNEDNL